MESTNTDLSTEYYAVLIVTSKSATDCHMHMTSGFQNNSC